MIGLQTTSAEIPGEEPVWSETHGRRTTPEDPWPENVGYPDGNFAAVNESGNRRSSELRRLDHNVLLITAVLWAAHLGILTTRSEATGMLAGGEAALVRLIVALVGMGSSLATYFVLRRRNMSATRRFIIAVVIGLPLSVALAFLNEVIWLFATDYYQREYGLGSWELLALQSRPLLGEAVFTAATYVWVYISWSALFVGSVFAYELRDRENKLAASQASTQEARLLALRVQLNPHFLFNTLNTLSGLISLDRKAAAERVLLNLSNLLRHSLSGTPDQLIPLCDEIEIQSTYLEIEKIRFVDRLNIVTDVEPSCRLALVPPLLVQPLIENTIKHAVAHSAAEVVLTIRARRQGEALHITIENSAASDAPGDHAVGFGIGLSNVRKRLAALYGDQAALMAGPTAAGGWINVVQLPWMEQAENARPNRR